MKTLKLSDLVRSVDYEGDGWGGDFEKVVGDQIGTVVEIDEDPDGTQYTVLFPDGTTVMDTASEFEIVKEAVGYYSDEDMPEAWHAGYDDALNGDDPLSVDPDYEDGFEAGMADLQSPPDEPRFELVNESKMKITKSQLKRIIREFSNRRYDMGLRHAQSGQDPDQELYDNDPDYAAGYDSYDHLEENKATKSAPFGSGMERADLEPDQKEIVGHT